MVEKNKFFEVALPIVNEKVSLLAVSELSLAGKTIKLDLTRRLRGKSVELVFKLIAEDNKIKAKLKKMHILGYFIRRMMRTSINYVEDSFSAESKNAILKIKPFLITRKKVSRVVRNALRIKCREEIINELKERTCEQFFSELIAGTFQKRLSLKLKKIYPLSFCDIRDTFIEKEISPIVVEEKVI